MAEWIISCNPALFDVFGAFEKLGSVDWSQNAQSIEKGDTVFIYVSKPVQAVALRCIATEVMIPDDQADHSDAEFDKGNSREAGSHYYMRLKLSKWIPPDMITFEKMQKAGLKGNIQGQRRLPDELRELFGLNSIKKEPVRESSIPEKSSATSIETQVNERVRGEFMRQIHAKILVPAVKQAVFELQESKKSKMFFDVVAFSPVW